MSTCATLPRGYYGVCSRFDRAGECARFTFQGETYTAVTGEQGFDCLEKALLAAKEIPDQPLQGRHYTTPVILVAAGEHSFGRVLRTPVPRAVTLLGEGAGVNPNIHEDAGMWPLNPRRGEGESVLSGLFYFGTLSIGEGTPGTVTLDGLTLNNIRVHDYRAWGTELGLVLKNCLFTGALTDTLVYGAPLEAGSTRKIHMADCRLDGFDSLDAEGGWLFGCATELTLEGLYFAHTRKFFGLTNYAGTIPAAPEGADARFTFTDCLFHDSESVHGLSIPFPAGVKSAQVLFQGCIFRDFAAAGDSVLTLLLPHAGCGLTLRDCRFSTSQPAGSPAVLIDGCADAPMIIENTDFDGFDRQVDHKPPRRSQGPEAIGQVVWPKDHLDDPHTPLEKGDFTQLWALYNGRRAYHGDMHAHSNSGGTSDGATPLAQFVQGLRDLDLDFAAIVDHRQMRHMYLPEWDESMLICGTEPGTVIVEDGRAPRSCTMHYVMLFQRPSDLSRVLTAFPEFEYSGGLEGSFIYPKFAPGRLAELARFIRGLGGAFSHAHPKQLMASDNPLDFYFTDAVIIETLNESASSYGSRQNLKLWEALLKMGKRVHTVGCSDTHGPVSNKALTTVYAWEHSGASILREVREGDCTAGGAGIKMCIAGARMGSSLPYADGMTLQVEVDDFYAGSFLPDTVYALRVYTDRGLAYASEFSGRTPQSLCLPVKNRQYYRAEITNESDGFIVAISNPIWLDQ